MSYGKEQCYARYNKTDYFEHLANRENCIFHTLVLEFEALESCLNRAYGDRAGSFLQRKQQILCSHVPAPTERNKNTVTSQFSDG